MFNEYKTTINVVTACDNAYVQHTAVFLRSLVKTNPNRKCRIFILVPDNFIHRESLEHNLSSHVTYLEFLKINRPDTASLKVSNHISVASYFRLFLDKLIPANVNRVIYLDSDILVAGPLDELWAVDLEKYIMAAVTDAVVNNNQKVRQKIGLAPTSNYFNAGVLVIDLCRWRNARVGECALDFAIDYPELITYWDQCALNHVLNGQFKELTKDLNFQSDHLRWSERRKCTLDTLHELDAAKIVHFSGPQKPWHYINSHPMKWLYWEYLRQTEWRDYCPPDRNGLNVLRKILENRAPKLLNAAHRMRKRWRGLD